MAIAVLGPNISFDPGGWSVLMAISFHQAHRSFSLQEGAAVSAGMRTIKIMRNEFHRKVQKFLANAFTSSMIRNMVQPGALKRIQDFLKQKIDLTKISKLKPEQYPQTLDQLTEELMQALPPGDRKWGVARKCLNLFFRDALYNFYLREAHTLSKNIWRFRSIKAWVMD